MAFHVISRSVPQPLKFSVKGRLLICQGMEDATVLPINSLSFIQSCVEHNVLADYFPYPCNEHNVTGKWREHLYLKFTDYFCTYL